MASGKEVTTFMGRKAATVCHVCGHNGWDVVGMQDQEKPVQNGVLSITSPDESVDIPSLEMPVIILICRHCAFLRLHATLRIEADTAKQEGRDDA